MLGLSTGRCTSNATKTLTTARVPFTCVHHMPLTPPHQCSASLFQHTSQPVAVAVEADSRAFQLYVGGVMSDPGCGAELNHGVLVVGVGAGGSLGHDRILGCV